VATDAGTAAPDLSAYDQLRQEPWRFSFYQAMRLIEHQRANDSQWGYARQPSDDPVRLAQEPSNIMAPASLSEFSADEGKRPRLSVLFFGLFGPNGPLPGHLTEFARDRVLHHNDDTLLGFLDIFHHRLLTYFYRIWADSNPAVNLERRDDVFGRQLGAFLGLLEGDKFPNDALNSHTKRFFAGHLGGEVKHPEGLLDVIRAVLTMPVRMEEFVGRWLQIEPQDRLRIWGEGDTQRLGFQATLGEKVWQRHCKFRLRVGPVTLKQYQELLPGGRLLNRLVSVVDSYVGGEMDWDVHLILDRDEATPTELGSFGQLGWTTWLVEGPVEKDLEDLQLNPALATVDTVIGSVARL